LSIQRNHSAARCGEGQAQQWHERISEAGQHVAPVEQIGLSQACPVCCAHALSQYWVVPYDQEHGEGVIMSTEIKRIKVDKDTRIEPILKEAGDSPVIVEFGNTAYRINPVGNASSPFTVESAYTSVQSIDGRTGTDISDEELEVMIDEAKDRYAQCLIEEFDQEP